MVSLDYSQIEFRIAAILAKDENLMKAFKDKIDIHTNTAEKYLIQKKLIKICEIKQKW